MAVESNPDDGFDAWYRTTWPKLVASVTVMVRSREVAQDLAGTAMVRAYERWDSDTIDSPTAWVYRVAINLVRQRQRRRVLELRVPRREIEEIASVPDVDGVIWGAVAGLPARQRTAIALRYLADLTQEDVASAMAISPGTAAATLAAARRNIRKALGEDYLEVDE